MADQYETITRAGPGTPMGELMRQYWIPAALSSELKADGSPVRILLLNEKMIAFRDTSGRVGIMDQRCPHRCASLFFGRNEENGIRCVYHGWKFDVDGNCLDQLNIPERQHFKDKVHTKAYLTKEHNGVIWVYMGDRNRAPKDLPQFECLMGPASGVQMRFVQRSCNWLQAVEGDLDTSHVGVLHFGFVKPTAGIAGDRADLTVNRAPEYKIHETDYGLHYGAHRPSPTVSGGTYWRVAHFLFPFWIMPPVASLENNVMVRAFIPMDDDHCMFVGFESTRFMRQNDRERTVRKDGDGAYLRDNLLPNESSWFGRYRMVENEANDYLIDREEQRTKSYTGVEGIHTQDQCVTESMGGTVDRSWENLAPSDIAIARNRRMLLNAVTAFMDGKRPPSADDPTVYANARGGHFTTTASGDWIDIYQQEVDKLRARPPEAAE
ncbi:MAG TPA: Rieske 2Fe-2S domain-containing protein [Stellaceae bacterium]|jgi:phenylpropionate dioxygenase-like ring-hydroxylating dioxygenase large terminal subunit